MSAITMTVIRHRGQTMPLGRNLAVRMLLDKSAATKLTEELSGWKSARQFCVRSFLRPFGV